MVKLSLVKTRSPGAPGSGPITPHRASATEGEAAQRLLEAHDYPLKRQANGQMEFRCPFHEEPGRLEGKKKTNFYLDAKTSRYFCQSASCSEKGNLQTLERHFGVAQEGEPAWKTRESQLRDYEANLIPERREAFYRQGLDDVTIKRFRLGYDPEKGRYVIPYLEGRRPVCFRFYNPNPTDWVDREGETRKGLKYFWEEGVNARLFNSGDAMGDRDGRVFLCEGELKAMLLCQLGYAAVAVPGATTFKAEWHQAFAHAKQIVVVFDNDNPEYHVHEKCNRCGAGQCRGHNPGQEAAVKVVEAFGWRAKNVVLPRPDGERKVDVNEYMVRDGYSNSDFAELALGVRKTPYKVASLKDLTENPPEESAFIVAHGILPVRGRLVLSGAPKVGKSILVQNMALSIASGIPFLGRFAIDKPHERRVLLLDRELSKRALYDRLHTLIDHRPGYRVAMENLLIDHDHRLRLDNRKDDSAFEILCQLIDQNGIDVVIMDTAYKFFSTSFTNEDSVAKAFDTLDRVIAETDASVVLTHHHRKRSGDRTKSKEGPGDPDDLVGSFLWTGWPNATILLNFLERRIESPFNTVCSFTAFRDDAPPDPLALYRDRDSIVYTAIQPYTFEEDAHEPAVMRGMKPTTKLVGEMLLEAEAASGPVPEGEFLHAAAMRFGCRVETLRPFLIDLLSSGRFIRTDGRPPVLKYAHKEEETYEEEHGLPAPREQLRLVHNSENEVTA